MQLRKTLYQELGQFERIFLIGNPLINLPLLPEPGQGAIPDEKKSDQRSYIRGNTIAAKKFPPEREIALGLGLAQSHPRSKNRTWGTHP